MSRPHLASALPLHLADRHFARALTARLARCRRWVELKMRELGCLDHPAFKLTALFDATAPLRAAIAYVGRLQAPMYPVSQKQDP